MILQTSLYGSFQLRLGVTSQTQEPVLVEAPETPVDAPESSQAVTRQEKEAENDGTGGLEGSKGSLKPPSSHGSSRLHLPLQPQQSQLHLCLLSCVHGQLDESGTPASFILLQLTTNMNSPKAYTEKSAVRFTFFESNPEKKEKRPGLSIISYEPEGAKRWEDTSLEDLEEKEVRSNKYRQTLAWYFQYGAKATAEPKQIFAILLSNRNNAPFYLSLNLRSSVKSNSLGGLLWLGRVQGGTSESILFDPTVAPHGLEALKGVNIDRRRLGSLKGQLKKFLDEPLSLHTADCGEPVVQPEEVNQLSHQMIISTPHENQIHSASESPGLRPTRPQSPGLGPPLIGSPRIGSPRTQSPKPPLSHAGSPSDGEIFVDLEDLPVAPIVSTRVEATLAIGSFVIFSWGREGVGCCRSETIWSIYGVITQPSGSGLVIGLFNDDSTVPRERFVPFTKGKKFSQQLRKQIHILRGLRRFLSLKTVSGFGVYQCDPATGAHSHVKLDNRTEQIMSQFYLSYNNPSAADMDYLEEWIDSQFNRPINGDPNKYHSVQLKLAWSVWRISLFIMVPTILSIAIGFYYQATDGDVQTAWTISSYIVTTSGILVALLAIATAAGHV